MKNFFLFAVCTICMIVAVQANNGDTLNVGKITYQPTIGNKIITIAKGDTVVLTGVDSLVTIKTDTITNSELVKVYVDGKVKLTNWVKSGYSPTPDPTDTTGQKFVYQIIGGDEDMPMEPALAWYWWILIMSVIGGAGYCIIRIFQ